MPDTPVQLDETRFREGQIILSFSHDALRPKNLAPKIAERVYQGYPPHPVFILPGLVAAIRRNGLEAITLETRLRCVDTLVAKNGLFQFLPVPSADLIKSQIAALA